jgi:hypothetical protein
VCRPQRHLLGINLACITLPYKIAAPREAHRIVPPLATHNTTARLMAAIEATASRAAVAAVIWRSVTPSRW